MKKAFFLLPVFLLLFNWHSYSIEKKESLNFVLNYEQVANLSNFHLLQISYQIKKTKLIEASSLYENSIRVLIIFGLSVIVLFIISIPLILLYFWLENFLAYQKTFKNKVRTHFWLNESEKSNFKTLKSNIKNANKIIKKAKRIDKLEKSNKNEAYKIIQESKNTIYESNSKLVRLQELPESIWLQYCKTFTNIIAYGFGFITWVVSSYFYIQINFDNVETGLKEYLRFPFKLYDSLSTSGDSLKNDLPMDIWLNMIFIVGVAIVAYFIGKFFGWVIVTFENEKPPKINLENVDIY
ncbi:MAG: hypothetical protein IZT56_11055 [Bacteroidetes bacterium]|nr:hypothetical protein [Bacteroidota bacterium]